MFSARWYERTLWLFSESVRKIDVSSAAVVHRLHPCVLQFGTQATHATRKAAVYSAAEQQPSAKR